MGRKVCVVEVFYPSWQPLLKMSVVTAISKQFGGGEYDFLICSYQYQVQIAKCINTVAYLVIQYELNGLNV